jgi:enamine deaminase RidA (YjgF/YER057c/UK114 family)
MSKQVIGGPFAAAGMKLPFSRAIRADDLVFVSGRWRPTRTAAWRWAAWRTRPGRCSPTSRRSSRRPAARLADVVKCTCWIDDPRDFSQFNAVFAEVFPSEPPARSTVISKLVLNARLEVEAIAYKPA